MNELDRWVDEAARALGLDPDVVELSTVLDLARDAAHGVARPAAPLTTFLAGLAAGASGGDPGSVADAVGTLTRLLAARAGQDTDGSPA